MPTSWILSFATTLVIVLTLIGIAAGRFPRLRMNRTSIALVGATALILLGAISLDDAYTAIDMNTILLLFAMMIINANLRLAGFFQLITAHVVRRARSARALLGLIIFSSSLLSALFLNDTIVLIFTPMVIEICERLKRDPIPYLLGLVTAANIGSVATVVGNPQNMIIGVASGIPFWQFTVSLLPVALAGMLTIWLLLLALYRQEFNTPLPSNVTLTVHTYAPLLRKGSLAAVLMIAAFVAGMPVPLAAAGAASLLLVTRRLKPRRIFIEVDGELLVFFASLFIITGAIERSSLGHAFTNFTLPLAAHSMAWLTAVAALLSNLISNVPAVLIFRGLIPQLPHPTQAWLTLAMATTFAGNLTLLGSVANLIVAETAARRGVHLKFMAYLRVGLPVTLLTLAIGVLWLNGLF
ncbi:MAG: anion transporter [Anaerolineales bacterium]